MINDILNFAARTLVTDGRLCMWMPTTSDKEADFPVPMHQDLEVISISVQPFSNCKQRTPGITIMPCLETG